MKENWPMNLLIDAKCARDKRALRMLTHCCLYFTAMFVALQLLEWKWALIRAYSLSVLSLLCLFFLFFSPSFASFFFPSSYIFNSCHLHHVFRNLFVADFNGTRYLLLSNRTYTPKSIYLYIFFLGKSKLGNAVWNVDSWTVCVKGIFATSSLSSFSFPFFDYLYIGHSSPTFFFCCFRQWCLSTSLFVSKINYLWFGVVLFRIYLSHLVF